MALRTSAPMKLIAESRHYLLILLAVDRPATTSAIVESIGAGTYRN